MKNIVFLLLFIQAFCFGQDISLSPKAFFPLYIMDGMVANEPQIKLLGQKEITTISIYKSDNLPKNLAVFTNFAAVGIINVTLKDEFGSSITSFEKLNTQNKLNELNPVYINGTLLKDSSLKIIEDAIFDIEIIENSNQKFLNIWTVSEAERKGLTKKVGGIRFNTLKQNANASITFK